MEYRKEHRGRIDDVLRTQVLWATLIKHAGANDDEITAAGINIDQHTEQLRNAPDGLFRKAGIVSEIVAKHAHRANQEDVDAALKRRSIQCPGTSLGRIKGGVNPLDLEKPFTDFD